MSFLPIFILGLIQGITEFLPISSSGHLLVVGKFLDFKQQSLLIDVSLHLGTLGAVLLYFSKESKIILLNAHSVFSNRSDENTLFTKHILFATVPIVIVGGLLFVFGIADILRNLQVIALATILFGVLLYFADIKSNSHITIKELTVQKSFLIGMFQTLSIIPGTSRAGIVYTGSRFLNLDRIEAASLWAILVTLLVQAWLLVSDDAYIFQAEDNGDAGGSRSSCHSKAHSTDSYCYLRQGDKPFKGPY